MTTPKLRVGDQAAPDLFLVIDRAGGVVGYLRRVAGPVCRRTGRPNDVTWEAYHGRVSSGRYLGGFAGRGSKARALRRIAEVHAAENAALKRRVDERLARELGGARR